jgi:hypothetical protein
LAFRGKWVNGSILLDTGNSVSIGIYFNGATSLQHRVAGSSIAFVIPASNGEQDFVLTRNGTTAVSLFVDGVLVNTNILSANSDFEFYDIVNDSQNGLVIKDLRIYNRALSESEIKAYHNSFVKPYLIEDFSSEGADGVAKVPTGWIKQSGSFKIGEITTPDSVLKTIKKGTKYLECVTAGVLAIPSKQAYGSWEFDVYKKDVNVINCYLLSSNTNGLYNSYRVALSSYEALYLSELTNGSLSDKCNTINSYIANDVWYRIKITRTLLGVFTVLIKGGSFTPTTGYDGWTLVSTTGGTGTNPVTDNTYTTSEYFVLDFDAGDRIANIKLTDGIIQQ